MRLARDAARAEGVMRRSYVTIIILVLYLIVIAYLVVLVAHAADPYQYERAWLPAIVSSPPPTATIDYNAPTPTPPNPAIDTSIQND
jgi:hypothetical protein